MRITFRQGIVSHQSDTLGTPTFLNLAVGKVSLVVSPDPTVVTFANGLTTNYLFTEVNGVANAWPGSLQPSNQTPISTFAGGINYWLYWDINRTTGLRSFGHTLLTPVVSATPPAAPQTDQHWFDTTRRIMFVREGNRWVEKVRVFAAKLDQGAILTSISSQAPKFIGTQVGLNIPGFAGALVFDKVGVPLRTSEGKFFTTEDIFLSGVPTGTEAKINTTLVTAEAQETLSAYTVVQFSALGEIVHANPFVTADVIWGIIEEDVTTGDPVRVVTEGIIRNSAWTFTAANTLVYFNGSGQVTTTSTIPNQFPIGFVIDKNAIVIRQPRVTIQGGASVDKATSTVHGIARLSLAAANANDPIAVGDNDPRLTPFDLTVTETNPSGISVSNVDTINFNVGTGFDVTDLGGGTIQIDNTKGLGSPLPLFAGDNVSELLNDAGYLTSLGSPLPLVAGDNVSELLNDAGYLTSLGSPLPLVAGDNVSELLNDAGYLTSVALDDLTDVSVGSPATGQVLAFNGTLWVPQTVATGGGGGSGVVYGGTDISVATAGSPLAPTVSIDYPLNEGPDGSIGAPTYSFASETNTGWYKNNVQKVCLSIVAEDTLCVQNLNGSPAPATGSPNVFDGVGIDLHVLNDGSGDSRVRIETDASAANALLQFITVDGTWTIVNDSSDDDLHFQWNGVDRFVMTDNPQLQGTDGAVGAPTYSFLNDTSTGVYLPTTSELAITTGGIQRISVDSVDVAFTPPMRGADGAAGAPTYSFTNSTTMGVYRVGADNLGFSTASIVRLDVNTVRVASTLPVHGPDGAAGTPTYSFASDTGVGIYLPSSDTIGFATGSIEKLRILPTGVLRSSVNSYEALLSNDDDIPNKAYVDSLAAGLDPKQSVRTATDVGSPLDDITDAPYNGTYITNTGSPPSVGSPTTLSGSFVGVDLTNAIGSVVVVVGDRVLIKDQIDAKQNGIYVVTTAGASGELDRASDQDGTPSNEVSGGNFTFVEAGSNAGSLWAVIADGDVVLNTDPVVWSQVSGAAAAGAIPALGVLTDVTDAIGISNKNLNDLYAFIGNGSGDLDVINIAGGSPAILEGYLDSTYLRVDTTTLGVLTDVTDTIGVSNKNLDDLYAFIGNGSGDLDVINIAGGSPAILEGYLDSTYLRLDTTNDPLTGTLTINGIGSPQLALEANGDIVVNSQVRVSDGSVVVPAYAFNSEPNTGWYQPDTFSVGLAVDGEEVIRVVRPVDGSPGPALGSPIFYDPNIGIELYLQNDGDGLSRITIETDHPTADSIVRLITASSTWTITNNASGGVASPQEPIDALVFAKNGTAVAVIEDTGSLVTIRDHFYRESIAVSSPLGVNITHGLGEQFVIVQVYDDSSPPQQIDPGTVELVDANTVRLTFSTAFVGTVIISG